ncbi:SNF2 family N-terminal domain-containing protein [Hypoxylon sp. FL0890]|nr:SNF2 family N-terminal domain-containing protein [Hypoxylon sp. FL0890]
MNDTPEAGEDMYMWPPASGIKRSLETTNLWPDFSEHSTAALGGPTKRACTSRLTYFQESDVPEVSKFEEFITVPPIQTRGVEDVSFIEPNPATFATFSSTHLLPLANDVGYSWQQSDGTSWQPQVLTDQYPSSETRGFGQQWTSQSLEGWHSFNLTDNAYNTRSIPTIAPVQASIGHNELGSRRGSECGQRDHSFTSEEATTSGPDDCNIIMNDNVDDKIAGFDNADDLQDQGSIQTDNRVPSGVSSTISPSMSPTITKGDLSASDESAKGLPYDSCFGVIILENFQLRDKFFTGKETKHVLLEVNGTMVIIKNANTNKYGGLLDQRASRAVVDLVRNHDVELSAYMKTPDRIEMLIYGRLEQSDAVGDKLLEQDYFLQRPDSYDPSRPYYNPQCLSDPDKEDEPFPVRNESCSAQTTVLDEKKKSKFAELLDSAAGPTEFKPVHISDILITKLKKHQVKGLSMMVEKELGNIRDAEFPSVWAENPDTESPYFRFYNTVTRNYVAQPPRLCLGGLLADEMGLGKTLTTLALIATSLSEKDENPRVARVTLIVCPMTTVTCWQDQIERHFKRGSLSYKIYHGSTRNDGAAALSSVDVVLTTYETLRAGLPDEGAGMRNGKGTKRVGLLHSIDWHRVVLDEAHVVRNRSTKSFQAVNMLKSRHRWCLTGTPIQNRLDDLGALVEFLKIDPFNDPSTFRNTFLTPIDNGEQSGWERLRSLITSIALRRTKKALDVDLSLPSRRETVHWIDLDGEEKALYSLVKKHFALAIDSGGSVMNTFQFILRLRQICNHGSDLLPQSLRAWLKEAASLGYAVSPLLRGCEVCDKALDDNDESSHGVLSCFHQVCQACLLGSVVPSSDAGSVCPICNTNILEISEGDIKPKEDHKVRSMYYRPSSKVKALLQNLQNDRQVAVASGQRSAKSVVFSTWTGMLDLIGEALSRNGFIYQRLDGSKSLAQRRHALNDFRASSNCTVLLASLGSAAVG